MNRRSALGLLLFAPAIIPIASLMPISAQPQTVVTAEDLNKLLAELNARQYERLMYLSRYMSGREPLPIEYPHGMDSQSYREYLRRSFNEALATAA